MTNRELDALVAEKVMGWTEVLSRRDGGGFFGDVGGVNPNTQTTTRVPAFSSTWAGTGLVVEEMIGREPPILFSLEYGTDGHDVNGWLAVFTVLGFSTRFTHFSGNPSAPRAVCLAALKAVGVEG